MPIIPYVIDKNLREICKIDLERISYAVPKYDTLFGLSWALLYNIPFRAVYQYRLKDHKFIKCLCNLFFRNKREIEISGNIEKGFCIFHGQGCVIHLNEAGKNLSIWQNVTIGRNPSKKNTKGIDIPSFGDNVNVYTNSVVAGGISIGSNVDIGAGSIVLKDIPNNVVVAGNPAKIIKYKYEGGNGFENFKHKAAEANS